MKRFLLFLRVMLTTMLLCAQEQVLFNSAAKADVDGYDYVSNFEIDSKSGYFNKSQLTILEPNERGLRFLATKVPKDISTSYDILTAYPSFLNENVEGAGVIQNAGSIKSIKVTATTNRPYDEIILLYSTSPMGPIKSIKMPQDFNKIKSMEEFTLTFENPLYEKDYKKREVVTSPVLGADAYGLYLRGFRIKTNAPSGYSTYSEYSVFYLKSVVVVCDKAFTDEQLEAAKTLKEEFGIKETENVEKRVKADIAERNRIREVEKTLMASEEEAK